MMDSPSNRKTGQPKLLRRSVRNPRYSDCPTARLEELDWERGWWTDGYEGSLYLKVRHHDGETIHRVYCQGSDQPRLEMVNGNLMWLFSEENDRSSGRGQRRGYRPGRSSGPGMDTREQPAHVQKSGPETSLDDTAVPVPSEIWRPLERAPRPGQRVEVKMVDGSIREARVTQIVSSEGAYLQYFHKAPRRRAMALDINEIKSWRPAPSKAVDR